jgi:hypothetical protein
MSVGVSAVGVLGSPAAYVDGRGALSRLPRRAVDWLVGAEDRWHDPRNDAAVRQTRLDPAPVYETRLRIPSGDALQRIYGVRAPGGAALAVIEVENASPAPFALAFIVHADTFARRGTKITLDDTLVRVDGQPAFVFPRSPMRWATGRGDVDAADVAGIVASGAAREGPFEPVHAPRYEEAHAGFVFPVAHRTTLRVAMLLDDVADFAPGVLASVPESDAARRGWIAQLDRAMRVELPGGLGDAVDVARSELLLDAPSNAAGVVALEDWGFDTEAAAIWARLTIRERNEARQRVFRADAWEQLANDADRGYSVNRLRLVRDVLLRDRGEQIDLLPGFPPEWLGQPIAVHDAPTRAGKVSFAVRWHGERPALLWEAPHNVELRAPALDPSWSARGGSGDALLAASRRTA